MNIDFQFLATLAAVVALWFSAKQVKALQQQNAQNEKKARQRATIDLALLKGATRTPLL